MFRLFSPGHLRLHETFIPPPNAKVECTSHETHARSEHISTPSTSLLTVASKHPPFATSEDPSLFEVGNARERNGCDERREGKW